MHVKFKNKDHLILTAYSLWQKAKTRGVTVTGCATDLSFCCKLLYNYKEKQEQICLSPMTKPPTNQKIKTSK